MRWKADREASGANYQVPEQRSVFLLQFLKIEMNKSNYYKYLKSKSFGKTFKNDLYILLLTKSGCCHADFTFHNFI